MVKAQRPAGRAHHARGPPRTKAHEGHARPDRADDQLVRGCAAH
jgi:hypothetical protein